MNSQISQEQKPKKSKKWLWIISGIIILAIVIVFIVYFEVGQKDGLGLREKIPRYSIGQNVIIGNTRWKVVEVKDRGNVLKVAENKSCEKVSKEDWEDSGCKDLTTGGKFIEVIMAVENLGDIRAGVGRVMLIDDTKREFEAAHKLQRWISSDRQFGTCSPILTSHQKSEVSAVYEIPSNTHNLKAEVMELIPEPKCDSYELSWEIQHKIPFQLKTALINLRF